MRALGMLDRLIGRIVDTFMWLALPLVLLLFLQWPLRDIFHAYSREANDLGQIIFALYVAVSVTAATRAGTHLAADALAQRYSPRLRRRIRQVGVMIGLVPWALFVAFAGKSMLVASLLDREAFPDTYNPGYFVLKLALWLMTAVLLAQAVVDIARPLDRGDG
jgi:TRAP-type mannitol/chloroaromatic compound transport system permease small subunit